VSDDDTKVRTQVRTSAPAAGDTHVRPRDDTRLRADPTLSRPAAVEPIDTFAQPADMGARDTDVLDSLGMQGAPAPTRAASGAPLREGDKVRGRFLLEELIGQGAMGQVWRAKDLLAVEALDRTPHVALKVLNSDFERHPDAFVALFREASRAQKLAHPNVVTVQICDRDEATGRAFIVMELLDGQPLDRVIRDAGMNGLAAVDALPIIRGMAEGLAYAHRNNIVHSDFKPANVFLTREGVPKILDFGIARAVQVADQAGVPRLPHGADDSIFQGYTPTYAAPETLGGSEPSTSEDVFALGVVSYELLKGRHPFNRRSAVEARAEGIEPEPLRGVKRRHARAIAKAMAFERAERFPDAAAFNKALQGVALLQMGLGAGVVVLTLLASGLWYRNYLETRPAVPFEQLPPVVQQDVREALRQGNESLAYLERTHDITASADAAEYFANAYALHPRNPDAVAGLERAADEAIAWYEKSPDRNAARDELRKFQQKSEYYQRYGPLVSAIDSNTQ
jgi:serine/threonine protein kinase